MTLAVVREPGLQVRRAAVGRPTRFDLAQAAIMLMACVAVWRIQDLLPILNSVKLQYIAPGLMVLAFVVDRDRRRLVTTVNGPLLHKILGVALIIALSIPTSLWPGRSFNFLVNDHLKTLLLMVMMAASVRSRSDLERYAWMHVIGASYYCYYVVTHFHVSARGRLNNLIYYDSNDLALLLVCTIPLCVYFLRPGTRLWSRLAAVGALAIISYTIVKSGSRGGFLGLLATGGYLAFSFTAVPKRVRLWSIGAVAAFLFVFGGSNYWNMMSSMLNPTQDYNWTADTGRKAIWKRGIGYMIKRPLTGVGARAFQMAEGRLSEISQRQQFGIGLKWSAAHNSFVEVGAELGVIGLGLFLASLYGAWKAARWVGRAYVRSDRSMASLGHALGGALIGYVVAGFFVSAGYSAFLYTIFAMVLALMKLSALGPPGTVGLGAAMLSRGQGQVRSRPLGGGAIVHAAWRRSPRYPGPAPLPGTRVR